MADFSGGYTAALDSISHRGSQDAYVRQVNRLLEQQAYEHEQRLRMQQQDAAAQAIAGSLLPAMFARQPQISAPPVAEPAPQAPAPGQASVPMEQPMPTPENAAAMAPGSPDRIGAPPGWQTSATAPEALGGAPAEVPAETAPAAPQVAEPPAIPQLPPEMLSVPNVIAEMQKRGVPPEQQVRALHVLQPIIAEQNKNAILMLTAKTKADQAAATARKNTMDAEIKRMQLESLRDYRKARGEAALTTAQAAAKRAERGPAPRGTKGAAGPVTGDLDEETLRFMAQQYWAGDNTVFQNLGRGAQSAKNIVALRKTVQTVGKETGQTPEDLASAMAEFQGVKAGQRTAGTRGANIEIAANEAKELAGLAAQASQAANRTEFKSLNDIQQAVQKRTASPELRQFMIANTSLINAYARAISPSGVPTVSDKDHAREMLDVGFSKGDYNAAVKQLMNELDAALKAPGATKKALRERVAGRQQAPGDTGRAPAGAALPQGWSVKVRP